MFSLSLPEVVTFYQESLRAPLRPANALRAAHVESDPFSSLSCLESPADEATPASFPTDHVHVRLQLPKPERATTSSPKPIQQGGGSMGQFNIQPPLQSLKQCRATTKTPLLLLYSEDYYKRRWILCQQGWCPSFPIRNRRDPTLGGTRSPGPHV